LFLSLSLQRRLLELVPTPRQTTSLTVRRTVNREVKHRSRQNFGALYLIGKIRCHNQGVITRQQICTQVIKLRKHRSRCSSRYQIEACEHGFSDTSLVRTAMKGPTTAGSL